MKQHLRKLSALLLTLVLAISLAPAALAVTPVNDTAITFGNVMAGDIVKAYPMATYDATYSSLVYHSDFQAFLKGKKTAAGATETLDEWFKNVGVADLNKYLVEYTSEALKAGTTSGFSLPAAGVVTGKATGTSVALTLKTGYYLILVQTTENNGKIYRPISIFLRVRPGSADAEVFADGNDIALTPDPTTGYYTINMKSEVAPVIAKKTRKYTDGNKWESNISASVGNNDPVEFYVEVKVPVYKGDPDLELTLNDTLQYMAVTFEDTAPYNGLKVGTGIDSTTGEVTAGSFLTKDVVTGVTVNPYDATTGTQNIQIKLDYSKLKNTTGGPFTVFYVHYYAILQKEAVENDTAFGASTTEKINAGQNSASLTYVSSADPAKPKTTDPVSVPVYTYSVKLDKQDMGGSTLNGAKFRLYSDDTMTTEVKLTKDAAGFYYPADHGATGVEIDTGTDSSFRIKGLNQGTYYLKETATASGYFLPKNGFEIVLTGEGAISPRNLNGKLDGSNSTFAAIDAAADGTLIEHTATAVDTTAVNQLDIVLKNSSQPILPSTGGMGTALFTFGGVALMVLAAGLTIYMRKRKEN